LLRTIAFAREPDMTPQIRTRPPSLRSRLWGARPERVPRRDHRDDSAHLLAPLAPRAPELPLAPPAVEVAPDDATSGEDLLRRLREAGL